MPIIVQKYGGSSIADIEKIKKVAAKIVARKNEGFDVAVVVSAMGKTTNEFIGMAREISQNPPKREMDMLLTVGERITMSLLCIAINDLGVEAVSLTGSQAGIITNDCHNDARVIEVRPFRVQDELRRGKIVVVGGFQGVSYKREITTLGRGGSDTSAVALAAALSAEACEIYSDVDGIYSADPNLVEGSQHLPEISYQMMQEMSMAGAKVLNAQAVEFAKSAQIALFARSTFNEGKETEVRKLAEGQPKGVKAVTYENDVVRVKIIGDDNKNLNWLLKILDEENVSIKELNVVDESETNCSKASFIISHKNIYHWEQLKNKFQNKLQNSLSFDYDISTLSIIGEGINKENSVLLNTLDLFEKNDIEVLGLSTTSFRLSFIVEKNKISDAVKLTHKKWIETA
ncbi:MAG: aspartate kinase [Rhodothermaceae bacterium]